MADILCHDADHPATVEVVITEDNKLRIYLGPWLRLQVKCMTLVITDRRTAKAHQPNPEPD
jgi:hypothetical protein